MIAFRAPKGGIIVYQNMQTNELLSLFKRKSMLLCMEWTKSVKSCHVIQLTYKITLHTRQHYSIFSLLTVFSPFNLKLFIQCYLHYTHIFTGIKQREVSSWISNYHTRILHIYTYTNQSEKLCRVFEQALFTVISISGSA